MKVSRFLLSVTALLALVRPDIASAGINTWTSEGPYGGVAHAIAVHPTQPDIVLRSTLEGLYRSTDAGLSWTRVREGNHADNVLFDPHHPGRAYVGGGPLYRSDDAGVTFTELPAVTGRPYNVRIAADGTLYGQGDNFTLSRSSDEGQTWVVLPRPWPINFGLSAIVLDPNDANVLYVALNNVGTFRSGDRGQTWTGPIADSPGTNVGAQPPNMVWSFVVQPGNSNRLLAATSGGFLISNDAGATWGNATPFRFAYWIGYLPSDPQRVIALGLHNEVMRSEDGGQTWPTNQDGADPRKYTAVKGFIDTATPARLWAASGDGVSVSSDWGATFTARNEGLRHGDVQRFVADSAGNLYASMRSPIGIVRRSGTNWLPLDISTLFDPWSVGVAFRDFTIAPGNHNVFYAANIDHVLARSLNAGVTWQVVAFGFPAANTLVEKIVVSPADFQRVFATSSNNGAWLSTDGGVNWTRIAALPNVIGALTIDPADPDVMYAGAGTFLPDTIYKSTNGGVTWVPTGPITDSYPNSIVIDPSDSNIVYATSNARLNKSVNGGATWTQIDMGGNSSQPINSNLLLIDPVITTTLFASAAPDFYAIVRSVDGGASWERLAVPPTVFDYNIIQKAILDPQRPSRVIANPQARGLMTFEVAPDLALSMSAFTGPLAVGTSTNATVTVRNLGPYASSASEVRITLPAWLTPTVPSNCSLAAITLTCRLGAIRVDQEAQIPLVLAVGATPGTGTVSAVVEGHEVDAATADNSHSVDLTSTVQNEFTLGIAAPATIVHDERATFTVTARNLGPSPATDTRIELPLGGFELVAVNDANGGTCSMNTTTNTLTCTYQALAPGAQVSFTVRADARTLGANDLDVTMTGAAASTNAHASVLVLATADLAVTVAPPAGTITVGASYDYTITVRNNGPDASEVSLDADFTRVTTSAATATNIACTRAATTLNCSTASLASGATATIVVTLVAGGAGASVAVVNARVGTSAVDPSATNNTANSSTTITSPASSSSSSGGGGGGGGAFDGLGLLLLGLLALARRAACTFDRVA
jgi:hypothetical protein